MFLQYSIALRNKQCELHSISVLSFIFAQSVCVSVRVCVCAFWIAPSVTRLAVVILNCKLLVDVSLNKKQFISVVITLHYH